MRIIAVTGGKGGIGKTMISVNLAVSFAKMNMKTMLLDADLGLANVDVALGLKPQKNLHDVIEGKCSLQEICIDGPHGIKIIPSSSGIQKMADLPQSECMGLINAFSTLIDDLDILIVDLASGVSSQVIDFTNAAQDIVVVVCNDPSSLMDSYAVIKILHQKFARSRFGIIINKVKSKNEGAEVFTRFQDVTQGFINVNMNYLGHIPEDDYVYLSAKERVALVDKYPKSTSSKAINHICTNMINWHDDTISGGVNFFLDRLVQNACVSADVE